MRGHGGVGLHARLDLRLHGAVGDQKLARHAVQFEAHGAFPIRVHRAQIHEPDEQRLAFLDLHGNFLAHLHPVEKRRRRQDGQIPEVARKLCKVREHLGIHDVAEHIVRRWLMFELHGEFVLHLLKIQRLQRSAGPAPQRLALAEDDVLELLRPAPHRFAQSAREHVNDRLRERRAAGFEIEDVGAFDAARDEKHRHVAHDLAAGGDLHNVAEQLIHLGIGPGDFRPAMPEVHPRRLFLEIRELAPGHFVQINFRTAGAGRRVERRVVGADVFPVVGNFVQRLQIKPGVALSELQRRNNGIQVGLAGRTRHGSDREVRDVHARFRRRQHRRGRGATRIVRVEMDRDADLLLQRLHQHMRRRRTAQARHVLDRQNMCAHPLQFLRQLHVVTERVFAARLVENVPRVADRSFTNSVRLLHRIHRDLEVRQIIERVEDAENINARLRRVLDETGDGIVRVIGITDRIRAAEQHLKTNVRHALTQNAQPQPRVFVQKSQRRVEGRPAPHLQAEQIRRAARDRVRHREHVVGAQARGEERLVRIAKRGVRDEQGLLLERPFRKLLRAQFQQQLPRAGRRSLPVVERRDARGQHRLFDDVTLRLRIAVHRHVAEEREQFGGAVAARLELDQFRRRINQRRRGPTRAELFVVNDVFEEWNVRLHSADTKFAQRAVHALERIRERRRKRREFDQQRIVKRRDHRAGVAHAPVEPQTEASGRAIRQDAPVVGIEFVFRVFRGDPALHGVTVARDFLLRRDAHFGVVHRLAAGDQNLRAHEINTGDDFRHGVLDLDARVHLDEEPFLGILVVEKFHGPGIVVFDFAAQLHRRFAQLLAHPLVQPHARRDLDDLLMPPLHRAIALVQMHHAAVTVAEDLHLDVLRVGNVAFEKHRRVAEGAPRFALRFIKQIREIAGLGDDAHPAATAAERGFDNERETNFLRDFERFTAIFNGVLRSGQRRHADFVRQRAGGRFVAHLAQQLNARSDERDARVGTSLRELRVLGQKTVARMNHVHALLLREGDDAGDVEIRADRAFADADQVRLVRLETMDRKPVLLGVDGHGAETQLGSRAKNADGNFAAVGDQQFPLVGRWRNGFGRRHV